MTRPMVDVMSDTHGRVSFTPARDPEMEAASQRARESFRYYWREMTWEYRRFVTGLSASAIKVAFVDPPNELGESSPPEHLWLNNVQFDGVSLTATLMNAPSWVRSVEQGQRVQVPFQQLGDWMYAYSHRCYGAFTVNVIRSRMEASERVNHDKAWGFDFGDPHDVHVVPDWSAPTFSKKKRLFGKRRAANDLAAAGAGQNLAAEHPMALEMVDKYGEQLRQDARGVLEYRDDRGFTPLHHMARGGALPAVELMLTHGADPRALTGHGWTAAQLAYSLGWHDVVALLQRHGG